MNDFSLHILDLAENSLTAGADDIIISLVTTTEKKMLIIWDNGQGIAGIEPSRLLSPFYTTRITRKAGLGLGLMDQLTRMCNGWIKVFPAKPRGLVVICAFAAQHWDLPPEGNIADTVLALTATNPQCRFRINYANRNYQVRIDSHDLQYLGYGDKKRRLKLAFTGWEGFTCEEDQIIS